MQQLEEWPIESLIGYAKNPRKNDHAVDAVAEAIREFGFRVPVLAKSDRTVVDGHLRLKAARKLGLETVPVILCDDMSEAQIKAFRISVNKVAELADWDENLLRVELGDLGDMGFDLEMTGFTLEEIQNLEVPAPREKPEPTEPEDEESIYGGLTSMVRGNVPMKFWRDNDYLKGDVLDFGCGQDEHEFAKYDPFTQPETGPLNRKWDTITCNYVLQTQPAEHLIIQIAALMSHMLAPGGQALIAVRNDVKKDSSSSRGFQKAGNREYWTNILSSVFWVEPAQTKKFHGFICSPMIREPESEITE